MRMMSESRHNEIAARLVGELERAGRLPLDEVIADNKSKKRYSVQVKELREWEGKLLHEHKTFIVAGPGGVPCRCCDGSGRESGS